MPKYCTFCEKEINGYRSRKFCSNFCRLQNVYKNRKKNAERFKERRKYREAWLAQGICGGCAAHPLANNSVSMCVRCLLKTKERRNSDKLNAFNAYGGIKCACKGCNITHPMILELDHIYGNGSKERKLFGAGQKFYVRLRKLGYPKGYQVLCSNCNKGKWVNGGTCPLHA